MVIFFIRFGSLIHQFLQLPNLFVTEVIEFFFCELDSIYSLFSQVLFVLINLLLYQCCIVLMRKEYKGHKNYKCRIQVNFL